jgi:hypothetical protein
MAIIEMAAEGAEEPLLATQAAVRDPRLVPRDLSCSVADPGCLSRILIFTHPGSRIQKQLQKRGVNKIFFVKHFFVATNFTKCLFLNCSRKNLGQI